MKKRTVIIIQARMGASRLPGKPLKTIAGKPLLGYLIERVKAARLADQVVVATTSAAADSKIVDFCHQTHTAVFVGEEQDVLDRYYRAALAFKADIVVRITGDNPLIDPQVIDSAIEYYIGHASEVDYVSNMRPPCTYPRGMDVEVFSWEALERIQTLALAPEEREHVTLYFYEHPEQFKIGSVAHAQDLSRYRWTVDTEQDLRHVSLLLTALYPANPLFTIQDLAAQLEIHPEWAMINAGVKQKPVRYEEH